VIVDKHKQKKSDSVSLFLVFFVLFPIEIKLNFNFDGFQKSNCAETNDNQGRAHTAAAAAVLAASCNATHTRRFLSSVPKIEKEAEEAPSSLLSSSATQVPYHHHTLKTVSWRNRLSYRVSSYVLLSCTTS
jgi:hypothetical protein